MWPLTGFLVYKFIEWKRVKKSVETVRVIKDREQLVDRECIGRLGVFILEKKLHSGRNWVEFLCVPIQKLGSSNEAGSQTESKQK